MHTADTTLLGLNDVLTHHQTIKTFDQFVADDSGKHCWKRRNCSKWAISPFPPNVSALIRPLISNFITFWNVVCQLFQFGTVKDLVLCKGLERRYNDGHIFCTGDKIRFYESCTGSVFSFHAEILINSWVLFWFRFQTTLIG